MRTEPTPVTDPLEQLTPTEDEQYLVSLLINTTTRSLAEDALATINPDDFASGHWAGIWATAQRLHTDGTRIDRRSLAAAADGPGASHALWRLGDTVPHPADYPHAITEVRRCGQLRRLLETTQRIQQRALSTDDPSQATAWAFEELTNLADNTTNSGDTRAYGELLDTFIHDLDHPETHTVIPTPWADVNDRIGGGLHTGRLYVVGARTGDGKSVIAHNLAEHAAGASHPALVFSVEMSALEVTGRTVAAGATIDMNQIVTRLLTRESWNNLHAYADDARHYPLYVNDRAELSISYIKAEARAQQRRGGLDLIVVDYLQLLRADRNVSREQQVAEISRGLKQLSRELGCAVLVPAQLNRKSLDRDRPTLADLRESGAIEQDSDVVILLTRQRFPADSDMAGTHNGMIDVNVAKNRHGDTATIELPFRGRYARIG